MPASAVTPTVRAVVVAGVDPISDPRRYLLTTEGRPGPRRATTLGVVGDIMLGRGVGEPAQALAPLAPRLRRYDLTVGNLESTLSENGVPQQGGDSFAATPAVVPLLERAGLDAVSLANNHTGDYQDAALLDTVRRLRGSRVQPFGAGGDLAAAGRAVVLRRGGVSFGFLGFNTIGETPRATRTSPGALSIRMPPRTGPLSRPDLTHVSGLVRRLAARVDVVVVLPHWGTQYTHRPEPVQRRVARRLVRSGADLVVGGHPHWVQGLDRVGRAVVAHSLGNFVFDMDFMTETQQGVVLEATFWGSMLKAVDLVPYRMDSDFAPRPVRGSEADAILSDVWRSSRGPFRAR
ncbi:MAG TPA: CapA family protein [Nocardioidaceae bacterium]|nr:CapA family protein [Nocardioidaceae bacterium]